MHSIQSKSNEAISWVFGLEFLKHWFVLRFALQCSFTVHYALIWNTTQFGTNYNPSTISRGVESGTILKLFCSSYGEWHRQWLYGANLATPPLQLREENQPENFPSRGTNWIFVNLLLEFPEVVKKMQHLIMMLLHCTLCIYLRHRRWTGAYPKKTAQCINTGLEFMVRQDSTPQVAKSPAPPDPVSKVVRIYTRELLTRYPLNNPLL